MTRKPVSGEKIDQECIDLFDEFTHSTMDRRVFMRRLAILAGSGAAATAMMPLLEGSRAYAAIIPPDDGRIASSRITYAGASGPVKAYLSQPKGGGKHPAVMVIHENRGLNPYTEDVARRLAVAGFLAIAPDALSPLGGTPSDSDKARTMIYQLDRAKTVQDFVAGVSFLDSHPASTGKVGCVGFCWGGAMSNQMAVNAPALDAAVVFYGASPSASDVPKIKAALLMHYAGLDARINAGVPAYEAALKANNKRYTMHMYPGVNHAFHADVRPARYDKAAAELAWQRTVDFLRKELS